MKTYLKNPSNKMTTKEYKNVEFRWWKFWAWYGTATYENEKTLLPINISVRMKKVFIRACPIGHELVDKCRMWDVGEQE